MFQVGEAHHFDTAGLGIHQQHPGHAERERVLQQLTPRLAPPGVGASSGALDLGDVAPSAPAHAGIGPYMGASCGAVHGPVQRALGFLGFDVVTGPSEEAQPPLAPLCSPFRGPPHAAPWAENRKKEEQRGQPG